MKQHLYIFAALIIAIVVAFGCGKSELPVVTTAPVTDITQTSAVAGGNITSDGDAAIKSHGVCWSTTPNPTLANSFTDEGKWSGGAFTSNITGLSPSSIYYVRAYATNKEGTGYGDEISFTTTLADIDGNVYKTVKIGDRVWMAENLRTTKYRNGNNIAYPGSDVNDWYSSTTGAYAWYDDDVTNKDTYGALYNWYTLENIAGLCPTGWSVPNDAEWTAMVNLLGGESSAGSKLKETGTTYWNAPNSDATNESGFSALPGGSRSEQGTYANIKWSAYFWTSSQFNMGNGWCKILNNNSASVVSLYSNKGFGYSVRCIMD